MMMPKQKACFYKKLHIVVRLFCKNKIHFTLPSGEATDFICCAFAVKMSK